MGKSEERPLEAEGKKEDVVSAAAPGDIGGGLSIGFATLCFCFWANSMGYCNLEGFGIAIGLVLIGFFVVYFAGGLYYLKQGNTLSGSVFVVFAVSFGLFGGGVNFGYAFFSSIGVPFDATIAGISFLVSGTFVLFMLPGLRYASKADFLVFAFAGIGVTSFGLASIGLSPEATNMVGGWALFFSGICVYYSAVAGVLKTTGLNLPCGAPFFRPRPSTSPLVLGVAESVQD